jgi:hypothetical protein
LFKSDRFRQHANAEAPGTRVSLSGTGRKHNRDPHLARIFHTPRGAHAPSRVPVGASPTGPASTNTSKCFKSQVPDCGEAPQAAREARALPVKECETSGLACLFIDNVNRPHPLPQEREPLFPAPGNGHETVMSPRAVKVTPSPWGRGPG